MNERLPISEEKIRPRRLFDEFLKLAEEDGRIFFKKAKFIKIRCPACHSSRARFAFRKNRFSYELCSRCLTLFVNPRPERKAFDRYYREAGSIKFLSNRIYKETEAARKRIVHQAKLSLLNNLILRFFRKRRHIVLVDIGAGYGTFCSEFINAHKGYSEVYAIEPSPDMAKACLDKGLNVINKPLEAVERWELPSSECRIFTCFELLEHLVDPGRFLTALRGIMKRNDILILSSLSSTGFDIQILWEKSRNVFAPHHLNFFNPDSSALLIERHGFRLLEISTPGRLDIDIVNNSSGLLKEKKFWSYFLNKISKKGKASLQRLLQQANLSSHMVVIAQRI